MELSKGDIAAIARFRAGEGKLMMGMLAFGILWIIGTLIALYQCTFNRDALIFGIIGIVVSALWLTSYLLMIELRTKKLVVKIREDYEKDIKS